MDACDVCDSPIGSGFGQPGQTWLEHVADHNDPHRTMDLVRRVLPRLSTGSVPPTSVDDAKDGDWFADTAAHTLWACTMAADGSLVWRLVASSPGPGQDLSGYATVQMLSEYARTEALSDYVRTSALPGLNYVTQSSLASALASYATKTYLAESLSSSGFITQTQADGRYMAVGSLDTSSFVTEQALSQALGEYLTADSASGTYISLAFADGPDGYVRKGTSLPYLTQGQLESALSGYARSSDLSGFVTKAQADARYVLAGSGTSVPVSVSDLNAALSAYMKTADAPSVLALSTYLKTSDADGPDGFLRKTDVKYAVSAAGFVTSSTLSATLAGYVTGTSLNSAVSGAVATLSETFATKRDLSDLAAGISIQAGTGTVLAELVPDADGVKPVARSNVHVVLTGQVSEIRVVLPLKSEGAARDFILSVSFDRGLSMWGGTSFTVVPAARQSETVPNSFYSVTDSVFDVDAAEMDLDSQMVVFGFTEIAPSRFLVTRKTVTLQGA